MQPGDGPDGELVRPHAKLLPRRGDFRRVALAAELLERHAQVDDFHFGLGHLPRLDDEIGCALRHGDRDVGVGRQQPVSNFLIPRRVGEVGVLVQDRGDAPDGRRHPSECRRAVSVQMKDIDLFAIDDIQERRPREGIESGAV